MSDTEDDMRSETDWESKYRTLQQRFAAMREVRCWAYVVASIDPKTLRVTTVDIYSEGAMSLTNIGDQILVDVLKVDGRTFADAIENAKDTLRTWPHARPLYNVFLKTWRLSAKP